MNEFGYFDLLPKNASFFNRKNAKILDLSFKSTPTLEIALESLESEKPNFIRLGICYAVCTILDRVTAVQAQFYTRKSSIPYSKLILDSDLSIILEFDEHHSTLYAQAIIFKFLADRCGLWTSLELKLNEEPELKLLVSKRFDTFLIEMKESRDKIESNLSNFLNTLEFDSLDCFKSRSDIFIDRKNNLIHRGTQSCLYKFEVENLPCVAKIVRLSELSSKQIHRLFNELYTLQLLELRFPTNDLFVKYYGSTINILDPKFQSNNPSHDDPSVPPNQLELIIIMEYCQYSVLDWIKSIAGSNKTANQVTPMSHQSMATLFDTCAKALCMLHEEAFIMHRDIKASNVLVAFREVSTTQVSPSGVQLDPATAHTGSLVPHFKVADFGLSKRFSRGIDMRAKKSVGTTRWTAPEVLLPSFWDSSAGYSKSCDIWSFGMMVIETITLKLPFHGVLVLDVPDEIQKKSKPQIVQQASHPIHPAFKELAEKCIEYDPSSRPTAAEIAAMHLPEIADL